MRWEDPSMPVGFLLYVDLSGLYQATLVGSGSAAENASSGAQDQGTQQVVEMVAPTFFAVAGQPNAFCSARAEPGSQGWATSRGIGGATLANLEAKVTSSFPGDGLANYWCPCQVRSRVLGAACAECGSFLAWGRTHTPGQEQTHDSASPSGHPPVGRRRLAGTVCGAQHAARYQVSTCRSRLSHLHDHFAP